jgi:hypothetical protein
MKRPPGWLIALTASIFLCVCGGCVVGGIKLRGYGSREIDQAITPMVSAQIVRNSVASGSMRIYEPDLDINNEIRPGEAGIMTGNDGTSIYGFETQITPDGIVIDTPGSSFMHLETTPTVRNGRIELHYQQSWRSYFMSISGFGKGVVSGVENGINEALEARRLKPVSVTMHEDFLIIETVPA